MMANSAHQPGGKVRALESLSVGTMLKLAAVWCEWTTQLDAIGHLSGAMPRHNKPLGSRWFQPALTLIKIDSKHTERRAMCPSVRLRVARALGRQSLR